MRIAPTASNETSLAGDRDPTDGAVHRCVREWLDGFVIAEGLCPFAARAVADGAVRVEREAGDVEAVLHRLVTLADALPGAADDTTVLLALTRDTFADFDAYLDLVALAEDLFESLGLDTRVQLASFHPDYRFDGEPADDPANWSNRSPVPLLHLLQVESLARAIDRHADPEGIPARNVAHLRSLGLEAVRERAAVPGAPPEPSRPR